jgi:hypothetical protein
MNRKTDTVKELAQELDAFDKMLLSLVEILEDKGILTQEEWKEKIKAKIEEKRGLQSYRDLYFVDYQ